MDTLSVIGSLTYDGVADCCDFIRNFRIQAEILSWNDEKQKKIFPLLLKGKAKRVFDSIVEKTTLEEMITGIKAGCS